MDTIDSAGCIVFKENLVLLVKYCNRFSFPKGHIEGNEGLEECAIRETEEETGIKAKKCGTYYCVESPKKTDKRLVYFFPSFYLGGEIKAQKEEIDEAMWVDCDKALSLLTFEQDKKALLFALRVVGIDIE